MAGVASCIVRFVCHIPTAMVGFMVLSSYQRTKTLGDILDVIQHGHEMLDGLKIVGILGWTVFGYNFIMFGVSVFASGSNLAIIGCVDLALASALVAGVVKQSLFLPQSYGACNTAWDWKNGTDGRNFFVVANATEGFSGSGSPKGVCRIMVRDWALALAITIIYLLCGTLNIVCGLCTLEDRRTRQHSCNLWEVFLLPFLLIRTPVRYLYKRCLPRTRFAMRYAAKFLSRAKYASSAPLKKKKKSAFRALSEKLILVDDVEVLPPRVVRRIAQKLHHVDLVNVNLASKQLRARFFGHDDPQSCLDELRQPSCKGKDKTQCRLCNTQVCKGCCHTVKLADASSYSHLSGCDAWCSHCYFQYICRKPADAGPWREHTWNCTRSARWKTSNPTHLDVYQDQLLCRACAKRPLEEVNTMLEEEGRYEIRRLAKQPLACGRCTQVLEPKGPRWWVCSQCQIECPSDVHPPWATGHKR